MNHNILSITALPLEPSLKAKCQALAMLDAILMEDWEYRYFSFDSNWDADEMMASMRDGSGNEYYILFSPAGVAGKVLDREILRDAFSILSSVPDEFSSFKNEAAFNLDSITCCFWKLNADATWRMSPPDAEFCPLLGFLVDNGAHYHQWAQDYFEVELEKNLVNKLFQYDPLDKFLVKSINPDASFENVKESAREIGYPLTAGW